MFKLFVFATVVCAARAGVIGAGYGHGVVAAPIAVAAPVAVAHGATSYQNSNLLALHPTPIITKVAAPVAVAAPVYAKVAAPVAIAAPLGIGYGHGLSYGYH